MVTKATAVRPRATRVRLACVLVCLLSTSSGSRSSPEPAQAADTASSLQFQEVGPGVFVHQGKHVPVEDSAHADIANIGFIVGERCVAVVDTGGSIAMGRAMLAAIRRTTDRPVCHVINTHGHYDHVLGNAAFRDLPGVTFVGHANLPRSLAASTELFLRQFAGDLGPDAGPHSIIAPNDVVADQRRLDLGGRILEVRAHPLAHTDTDLTVLDMVSGILWAGDLVFLERIPSLDGSLGGWIDVLQALTGIPARGVVPGHGPVLAPWPDGAGDTARYLGLLRDEVRDGIAAGKFMEDLMEVRASKATEGWLLPEHQHARNVSRAFTELEWE